MLRAPFHWLRRFTNQSLKTSRKPKQARRHARPEVEQLEERRLLDGYSISVSPSAPSGLLLRSGEEQKVTVSYTIPASAVGDPDVGFGLVNPYQLVSWHSPEPTQLVPTQASGSFEFTFRVDYFGSGYYGSEYVFPNPMYDWLIFELVDEEGSPGAAAVSFDFTVVPNAPFWALPPLHPLPADACGAFRD